MPTEACEFTRRFLFLVPPGDFHRIRHYELLTNPVPHASLARMYGLLYLPHEIRLSPDDAIIETRTIFTCRHCVAPLITSTCSRAAPRSAHRQCVKISECTTAPLRYGVSDRPTAA